jgi:hypothetical protein
VTNKQVRPTDWYTAREAAFLLGNEVTEATVKEYCKTGKLRAKKVGPRQRWMIQGSSVLELRTKWEID